MFGIYDINDCSMLDYQQRLNIYKEVGFEELGLYIDAKYMAGSENYRDIICYAKSIGLAIKQVHVDYHISNNICNEESDEYFDYIEQKLKECVELGIPYMVAHASKGDCPPIISSIQLSKMKALMKKYKQENVILCLENVRNNNNLDKILSLNMPNIKMCYDLGHAHCYCDEAELLNSHRQYIVCSHLHNNNGTDQHNILTQGEIVYKPILEDLFKISSSNCLECFPPRGAKLTEEEFRVFVQACYDSVAQ